MREDLSIRCRSDGGRGDGWHRSPNEWKRSRVPQTNWGLAGVYPGSVYFKLHDIKTYSRWGIDEDRGICCLVEGVDITTFSLPIYF
jgi:hypothetical protein